MSSHTFGLLNPILEPATSSDPDAINQLLRPNNPSYPSDPEAFKRSQTVEFMAPLNPVYPSDNDYLKPSSRPSMPLPNKFSPKVNQSSNSLGKALKTILNKEQLNKLREAYARSSASSRSPSRSNSQSGHSGKITKIKLRPSSVKSQALQNTRSPAKIP